MAVNQTLTLTQVSQNTQNNTSQVRILWQSVQTGESYNETSRTAYYYISVNGAAEEGTAITYTLPYRSTKTLLDKTVTVYHSSNGTGSIKVRTWMDTNISAGVVELSKTLTLTQIPRESTLSASDALIGGTSKIAVSKKNEGYTHSIAYKFGSLTGYVTAAGGTSTTEAKFSGETVDFTVPTSFYTVIPNSSSGVCTLTLRTYSGSTQIGSEKTATFTVSAGKDSCAPTLSCSVADVNSTTLALTGSSSSLVRYHSNARCTVTATAKNSASIANRKVNGQTVSGSYLDIAGAESGSFSFQAEDSRGFISTATVSKTLIAYVRLTNNSVIARNDPTSGKATLTIRGSFFNGSFGAVNNALTVKYRIGSGSYVTVTPSCSISTYVATVPLTGMNYEQSYTVTVAVSDKLESVTKTLTLGKGLPVFDWGEKDFAFHVPVSMDTALSMANGGTGRKDWNGLDTDYAVMAKSPNGAWMTAIGTQSGAFYATATNGAPRFGILPIAQGGTGATTAEAARAFLGAAPAGMTAVTFSVSDFTELETELKSIYSDMAASSSKFMIANVNGAIYDLRLWKYSNSYGTVSMDSYAGAHACRKKIIYNGVWDAWEYPNPPMALGVEYRTTQRWQNKPVYTKLVNFGALPNATTKSLTHGIAATQILRAEGQASNGQAFPICGSGFYNIELRAGLTSIDIYTDYNYSACTATVQLWYTKS